MAASSVSVVCGQAYPAKPIRIITSGVGGGSDFTARLVAQGLTAMGQPVIVDNRGGEGIQGQLVSKAAPDGYTLLVYSGTFWTGALLRESPYDVERDFAPIVLVCSAPNVLVVHPSLPVRSVRELIALAKAKPGELNYSSGSTGTSSHLAAELFKATAGIRMVRVPYKTTAQETADLIGGQVQLTFGSASSVMPQIKAGKLRALGVTSLRPSILVPGLPTIASSGLPGFEAGTLYGMWAPARTADAIIRRLNQETVRFINTAETKERLLMSGVEAVAGSPEEFAAAIRADILRMGKVIKDAGIRRD